MGSHNQHEAAGKLCQSHATRIQIYGTRTRPDRLKIGVLRTIHRADGETVVLHAMSKTRVDGAHLDGVDLAIPHGQLAAFLGPSGSGRSLIFDIVLALLRPDNGEVQVLGQDPANADIRSRVGATPAKISFPEDLRVEEVVDFVCAHFPDAQTPFSRSAPTQRGTSPR